MVRSLALALACSVFITLTPASMRGVAARAQDLPPRDAFLREVREALSRSQEAAHRYAYKERRTELNLNPFGRMGTGDVLLFDVRPATNAKLTYRKLIARNGVPVAQAELDRQDAEYAERRRRLAKGDSDEERKRADDRLASKRAQMIVDDVVDVLQFELTGREFHGGRPQIVVSFSAKPGARAVTREGNVVKAFRGKLWIDEATRELVAARATAIDDVGFGGGVVGKIYEGMESTVERREVDRGVWMPTRLTLTGEVRAIFRKTRIEHVVEWFDYRAMY